jgi:hypothetical protein
VAKETAGGTGMRMMVQRDFVGFPVIIGTGHLAVFAWIERHRSLQKSPSHFETRRRSSHPTRHHLSSDSVFGLHSLRAAFMRLCSISELVPVEMRRCFLSIPSHLLQCNSNTCPKGLSCQCSVTFYGSSFEAHPRAALKPSRRNCVTA